MHGLNVDFYRSFRRSLFLCARYRRIASLTVEKSFFLSLLTSFSPPVVFWFSLLIGQILLANQSTNWAKIQKATAKKAKEKRKKEKRRERERRERILTLTSYFLWCLSPFPSSPLLGSNLPSSAMASSSLLCSPVPLSNTSGSSRMLIPVNRICLVGKKNQEDQELVQACQRLGVATLMSE